jgi:hypothetical protein
MKTLMEITKEMQELDFKIGIASDESIRLRMEHKLKEALYVNELSKNKMKLKVSNPSWRNPDIEAMANNMAYDLEIEMIKAESAYLSKKNEAQQLGEQKNTLENECWNLRAELKKFVQ